jgi:hypothetical protein
MKKCLFFTCVIAFLSFGISTKKIITDKDFKYEFYTTDQKLTPHENRMYFWFKGGTVHSSEYGIAGELLQDAFLKYYLDNQLAESGNFDKGLKTGVWKNWYPNGRLQTRQYWQAGQKDGKYLGYNGEGTLIEQGAFRDNKKQGRWIDFVRKDTVVYEHGEIYIKKPARFLIYKRTPEEKKRDSISKAETARKKTLAKHDNRKSKRDSAKKTTSGKKQEKKEKGFFQRLFSKKETKSSPNAKG